MTRLTSAEVAGRGDELHWSNNWTNEEIEAYFKGSLEQLGTTPEHARDFLTSVYGDESNWEAIFDNPQTRKDDKALMIIAWSNLIRSPWLLQIRLDIEEGLKSGDEVGDAWLTPDETDY